MVDDVRWFNRTIERLVEDEISSKYLDEIRETRYFNSFMR